MKASKNLFPHSSLFLLLAALQLSACHKGEAAAQAADTPATIVNYHPAARAKNPQAAAAKSAAPARSKSAPAYSDRQHWLEKWHKLDQGAKVKFRIIQLGDSHTAGDYFSHEVRSRLQQRWGDGGIGWVFPNNLNGQRSALISYQGGGWQTLSSRKEQADFPLGGALVRSNGQGSLTLSERSPSGGEQDITLMIKPLLADNPLSVTTGSGRTEAVSPLSGSPIWQYSNFSASLPLTLSAGGSDLWEIGLIGIENRQPGIVYSALGINGSQLAQSSRWRAGWEQDLAATRADLVVLAYGTNEAFNPKLDLAQTEQQWHDIIARIRKTLPNAGIMVIGAPESLKSTAGSCGQRPAMLDQVQQMQQRIAESEGLLYWSWQTAMGGNCSMKNWMGQNLGARDGVHFSAQGYRQAGAALADDIIRMVQER